MGFWRAPFKISNNQRVVSRDTETSFQFVGFICCKNKQLDKGVALVLLCLG